MGLENKMSTKVDQASAVEPRRVQTTGTTTSSAASTGSPKIPMFGAKSGFVIPKNKLSGSLVPIFRGGKKLGGDAASEESTKPVQRKTKWGPDLTQDAAVRRGRTLAYQTRVDQIAQQLKSGILEIGDSQDLLLAAKDLDQESHNHQINNEKSELLELERREAIGEILKLDPSYKAPPDYKPLLKEARVPIPVKEYPGYNFLGLIFGSGSDTQKRLEKETGTKIRVYGTKADTGEKDEIVSPEEKEIHGAYEELYVLISADTYEKVDAAVALIELLVTPVSGKPAAASTASTSVSGDDVNVLSQSQDTATVPYMVPTALVNQGVGQPVMGPTQASPQGQFRYPGPWLPHPSMRPPFGFNPPPNTSASILTNPAHISSSPYNPSNMPSLFGPRPAPAAGFGSVLQSPSLVPRSPQQSAQVLQRPYMPQARPLGHTGQPRNPSMPALQPLSAQHNMSAPLSFTGAQSSPMGPPPNARSFMPSPQPGSKFPPGLLPDRPLTPAGSSTGWSGPPAGTPTSLGLSNMAQMAPPIISPQGPRPVVTQPIVASSTPPSSNSAANMVSPVTFPSQPSALQLSTTPLNRPIAAPVFSSVPPSQVRPPPASSASLLSSHVPMPAPARAPIHSSALVVPMQPVMTRASVPNPSPNTVLGSTPLPSTVASTVTIAISAIWNSKSWYWKYTKFLSHKTTIYYSSKTTTSKFW
ncbi:hypothetical protein L1049_018597 [Liquidambar formosana]|uniref:K Homology domain-containing protein n=1 Tax=Liquidambar formosana TaxID=63359 RepID=A0AAP0WLY0_LIQFO